MRLRDVSYPSSLNNDQKKRWLMLHVAHEQSLQLCSNTDPDMRDEMMQRAEDIFQQKKREFLESNGR